MTSVIREVFSRCRDEGRPALIPYLTAGDPDLETASDLFRALAAGGADLVEVGIPFSDPIADGPVNQRSAQRALASGATPSGVLDMISKVREELGVPVVLFTYLNPLLAGGLEQFFRRAARSGVDGVLCLDLLLEEARGEYLDALEGNALDPVFLLTPTSAKNRVQAVRELNPGFVYYVARTGVTGASTEVDRSLLSRVRRLRKRVKRPVAVGFGLGQVDQVRALRKVADGIVVGSALVRTVEDGVGDRELPRRLERQVRELADAIA